MRIINNKGDIDVKDKTYNLVRMLFICSFTFIFIGTVLSFSMNDRNMGVTSINPFKFIIDKYGISDDFGIEIKEGYSTYAVRGTLGIKDNVKEYVDVVARYDKTGKLKYFKYTNNYPYLDKEYKNKSNYELQEMVKNSMCINVEKLSYDDLENICEVKNKIYVYGYTLTDKTLDSGILGYTPIDGMLKQTLEACKRVETEEKAKVYFEELRNNPSGSSEEFIIMANKKVNFNYR